MISSARALRNKSYVIQRAAPCMIGPIMHGVWANGVFVFMGWSFCVYGLNNVNIWSIAIDNEDEVEIKSS